MKPPHSEDKKALILSDVITQWKSWKFETTDVSIQNFEEHYIIARNDVLANELWTTSVYI